jgi:ribosomal protein S18 acetylase RimI-like enzyme
MNGIDIRPADKAEAQAVLDTLVLAFARDPVFRYWWPRAGDYLAWTPRLALAMGQAGFDAGTVFVTAGLEAAAIWLPPGVKADSRSMGDLDLEGTPEQEAIAAELRVQILRHHPTAPHWYLWLIGVDPRLQGRGLGSALLRHTLRLCDERGETAYLESSDRRNVPLYERHGFETLSVVQVADVPPITPMIRRPLRP